MEAKRRPLAPFVVLGITVVIAGLFWILVVAKNGADADSADTPLMNKPAPVVKATALDGTSFDLQRRKGSWVVLNFFNSTCVPCEQEHAELVKFDNEQKALGADGVELYTVASDNDTADVKAFFAANGGTWPVLVDSNGAIDVAFGVAKVPETWIIDPNGYVRYRTIATGLTDNALTIVVNDLKEVYNSGLPSS
jgi:cytochrome c biogenesis protein CcmG/thiol:disulfide interchange protein DsbE